MNSDTKCRCNCRDSRNIHIAPTAPFSSVATTLIATITGLMPPRGGSDRSIFSRSGNSLYRTDFTDLRPRFGLGKLLPHVHV
jgi:hypothetical protein